MPCTTLSSPAMRCHVGRMRPRPRILLARRPCWGRRQLYRTQATARDDARRSHALSIAVAAACVTIGATYSASRYKQPILLDSNEDTVWRRLPAFFGDDKSTHDQIKDEDSPQSTPRQTRTNTKSGEASDVDGTEDDFFTGLWNRISISDLGDKIGDAILPTWFKSLPGYIKKLQAELSFAPGSLAEEIWFEANDVEVNPEIIWDAQVRVSQHLCPEEQVFTRKRKHYVRRMLAKYIDVPLEDIHLDDIPTIAICGSGGGLRAMVAGISSLLSAGEAGLFDCATYTAGVSGSCWAQTLFYSSIGRQDHAHMIEHLKHRLGVHIAFPPPALNLISSAPTNKYLLSGVVERLRGLPEAGFGLVDVYGLLLAARLMVPKGDLGIDYEDMKVSEQKKYLEQGEYPLPIYTAVRHEIPKEAIAEKSKDELKEAAKKEAWFQWFEWTPYEFFCEELEAGIPTWAVGRKYDRGQTKWRDNGLALPELKISMLMGIWGSAFCATVSHYYKEVKPVVQGLIGFRSIDELIAEKDQDLVKLHPIDPATIPNFMVNMRDQLPPTCPESVHSSTDLQLMDAGMSNNLPLYPLLRPGREVDIIVAFDASADVRKDNWLKVTDGYARQRGIKGWPMGAGWPPDEESTEEAVHDLEEATAHTKDEASAKMEDAKADDNQARPRSKKASELGYCTVWVGNKEERTEKARTSAAKKIDEQQSGSSEWELAGDESGIAVIYFPLLANEPQVPGVKPQTSDFLSTWNFVYSSAEIDKVVSLARANFEAGREQTRRTVKAVWQRKRKQRLELEEGESRARWALYLSTVRKMGRYGDGGDHFS